MFAEKCKDVLSRCCAAVLAVALMLLLVPPIALATEQESTDAGFGGVGDEAEVVPDAGQDSTVSGAENAEDGASARDEQGEQEGAKEGDASGQFNSEGESGKGIVSESDQPIEEEELDISTREGMDELALANKDVLPDGFISLAACVGSDLVLDVRNGGVFSGSEIQIYSSNGTDAQAWEVIHDPSGYVTLLSAKSGLALDVSDGLAKQGSRVQLWESNGTWAQKWIAVAKDDSIELRSAIDASFVLDVKDGLARSGAQVQLWEGNDTLAQLWRSEGVLTERQRLDALAKEHEDVIADGEYVFLAGGGTRKVLDVSDGSARNAANVQLYSSNMTNAQSWVVTHDSEGYVRLTNKGSGKALDVANGSSVSGANVQQYTINETNAQRWIAVPRDGGGCTLVSALNERLVLDVYGASFVDGANVQIWTSNGSAAQCFTPVGLNPSVAPCGDVIPDGWYEMVPQAGDSFAIDIADASSANGANVQLYAKNDTFAQMFSFEYESGYYRIRSASSGKSIDVAAGGVVPGTNVQQWADDAGNSNQLFSVVVHADGTYSFINVASGLALDVANGGIYSGANVWGYTPNGTAAQKFSLEKKTSLIKEGIYSIAPVIGSGRALDVSSASREDGANVWFYSKNNSFAQKWKIAQVAGLDNVYTMEALCSGMLLTADGAGDISQRAVASDPDDAAFQQWEPNIQGGRVVFRNIGFDGVLEVSGASFADGTDACVSAASGSDSQRFSLSAADILPSGYYAIETGTSFGLSIDVANGSYANGANVRLWGGNGTAAQVWLANANADGSYTFINGGSGKALDVSNGNAFDGTNVQQWEPNGSAAQKWFVSYGGSGRFRMTSALNQNLVLAPEGDFLEGANLCLKSGESQSEGIFAFRKTELPYAGSVLGVSRPRLVGWLKDHQNSYYLGTRYSTSLSEIGCMYPNGDSRSDGYTGMNCGGFVAHAYRAAGGNLGRIASTQSHSPWAGGPGRGGFVNAWRWYGYAIDSGAQVYTFNSVNDLLSSGKAEKGDMVFFYPLFPYSDDCHIGFFWGDNSWDNVFWHSDGAGYGNRITGLTNIGGPSRVVLMK